MSTNNMKSSLQKSYYKINQIRTKLLLFIDKEIQSKIKQNTQRLKYNCKNDTKITISFEETFSQNQTSKNKHSSSITCKTPKIINSGKTFSTVDDSSNTKEENRQNKLSNNIICFRKKTYSIKNLSKQSSTFLILPNQKNSAEYLKTLCDKLKICENEKKPAKHIQSSVTKSKLSDLNKDKRSNKKSSEKKLLKSKKDNQYNYSLFRKSQKEIIFSSKSRFSGKSKDKE